MTPIWGLTEGARKQTGRDPRVQPRTVVYDPVLTLSLPAGSRRPSGMNALAHCVEALLRRGASPITTLMAEEGIRVLARGLPRVVAAPDDLEARAEVLVAAPTSPGRRSPPRARASTTRSATSSAARTTCRTPRCTR